MSDKPTIDVMNEAIAVFMGATIDKEGKHKGRRGKVY
jgi:hypothetical protein